jgi:phosphatidate cytidylyltransferase
MARIVSGAVLIAIVVAGVWLAPLPLFFALAELILVLAFVEYARLAEASNLRVPRLAGGVATIVTSMGLTSSIRVADTLVTNAVALDAVVLSAFVVLAALSLAAWSGGNDALPQAAAAVFPMLYLGLPFGSLIALRTLRGPAALFLLLLTVMVSDTAQYYSGRLFGRRPLAPAISPKKTIEGAIGGFVGGALILTVVGAWWLPDVPPLFRALLGVAIVALGIAGDLFESMLKRSAGVKDSSALIPGHGRGADLLRRAEIRVTAECRVPGSV